MSKFKVGDRVKVKRPKTGGDEKCRWTKGMDRFDGAEVEVSDTETINKDRFLATNGFYFLDEWVIEDVSRNIISPHYTENADGKDYLQRFFENSTPDEINGAMKFTIGKYIERLGKKDDPVKELSKVIDYATRWRDHLNK